MHEAQVQSGQVHSDRVRTGHVHATQIEPTADGAILFDATACGNAPPDGAWFDAAHWSSLGHAERRAGGRGGVAFVETPAGACVLRHYRRGGVMAHFSPDRYFWSGASRTRAFREFRLLDHLVESGLPAPAPVAARYRRKGFLYVADLIMRRIPAETTLADRVARDTLDATLGERVGRTIARFHGAGICHADLNAHNILIDGRDSVSLIDFDRGTLRKPALAWQQANLARLRRSLRKLGAVKRMPDFDRGFWHPLLGAYHAGLAQHRVARPERGAAR